MLSAHGHLRRRQARVMSRSLPSSRGDYGGGPTGLALALTARVARRAAGRAANVLARLDLRYKLVGSGLPKNYVVIARK